MSKHRGQGRTRKGIASSHRRGSTKRKVKVRKGNPEKKRQKISAKELAKRKRSLAAKKGHATRRLKFKGVYLDKRWEGKSKDGSPSGYTYERYNLPILDVGSVRNVIAHVKKTHKGKRFVVGGQCDFRDKDERLFTNNASLHLDTDNRAPQLIISSLHQTIQQPSNPFQVGRSNKIDVENIYVLIRFKRERFHEPRKATKKKPVKRKPVKRKPAKKKPVKRKR